MGGPVRKEICLGESQPGGGVRYTGHHKQTDEGNSLWDYDFSSRCSGCVWMTLFDKDGNAGYQSFARQ